MMLSKLTKDLAPTVADVPGLNDCLPDHKITKSEGSTDDVSQGYIHLSLRSYFMNEYHQILVIALSPHFGLDFWE